MNRLPAVSLDTELALGRIREARVAPLDPRSLVLAVIPEVETRVDVMIRDLVSKAEFAETPLGAFLISNNLDSYFQTWKERQKILRATLDFDGNGGKVGQQFQLLLEVRNSLMHGNGAFTRQQSKSFQKVRALEKSLFEAFSIETQGQLLILENINRTKVCEVAGDYLIAVDEKYREPPFNG